MIHSPTVIDLFCGAGGFSEGFRQAGYTILAGMDSNPAAANTYTNAHPKAHFFTQEIQKVLPKVIRKSLGLKKGQLDCLIGGPPCQAYSINNHKRGLHDNRAKLFRSYINFVKEFEPKWIVLENVTGIFSAGNGKAITEITDKLKLLGYKLDIKIIKAEDFGVPQLRRRVFIVGCRTNAKFKWPKIQKKKAVTIRDALLDLPSISNGEKWIKNNYTKKASSPFQKYARKNSYLLNNHITSTLSEKNLSRLRFVSQGGNWRDIPKKLLPAGMQRAKSSDHTKRYGRLSLNGLSSTILTKCDMHWGCYIHPTQDRIISVREAARLQSFPDSYLFKGSMTEQYLQVGNAVPPLVAKALAKSIKHSLS